MYHGSIALLGSFTHWCRAFSHLTNGTAIANGTVDNSIRGGTAARTANRCLLHTSWAKAPRRRRLGKMGVGADGDRARGCYPSD